MKYKDKETIINEIIDTGENNKDYAGPDLFN